MNRRNRLPHGLLMATLAEDLSDQPQSSRQLTWMKRPERPETDETVSPKELVPVLP